MLEAIARLGTFRAAAAELNATPSAISHRIADLESNLGCLLFTRNGRSVQITSAGKEYAREIRIALGMMAQSQNRLLKGSCNVPIRIALIPPFAHYWLVPRLTSLEHSFPYYSFDFIFVNQPTEEVGNEVDFVIDYGADELFVERGFDLLLPRRATLVAAPEYHAEIKGKLQSSPLEGYRLLENANLPLTNFRFGLQNSIRLRFRMWPSIHIVSAARLYYLRQSATVSVSDWLAGT